MKDLHTHSLNLAKYNEFCGGGGGVLFLKTSFLLLRTDEKQYLDQKKIEKQTFTLES